MKTFNQIVNTVSVEISSKSKYTLQAVVEGQVVATAPSVPKILAKLELMFPAPVAKAEKSKKPSMRQMTLELMLKGEDDNSVLVKVTETFTGKAYNLRHVKWYRSTFVRDNVIPVEFAPKNSKAYKEWVLTQESA